MKKLFYLVSLVLVSCQPHASKNTTAVHEIKEQKDPQTELNIRESKSPKVYHASRTQLTSLINTKLEVSFDWEKSQLIGKETLEAKPYFYPNKELILDAQGMQINRVTMNGADRPYTYKDDVLTIQLDKTYTRDESYKVVIEYVSKPEEREIGGSAAITSDKGLYFINAKRDKNGKMPQIWTQGETQANSVWFPTIDAPNSKTKQEIYLTVEDKYVTLSNGKLISSTKNADGTRTDYWKQELPHAPYLFMMGVGEFKVVKDSYTRKDGSKMEVNYYVEPEWEKYAKDIFGETPEMIRYFSELLDLEYPWDKYHQIVVRDYVSGAMENTGAVIFGDFVYKTDRELLDANDQSTIAHELFHHWFGDLVTCESWSNLTVNESFANYSQYLWDEHRYGRDEAEYQALQEREGYFMSAKQSGYHDLVWFDYETREQMFDGHSYNKGGRILHMLRTYLGDEAFFKSLTKYLKTNQFKTGEFHQLRLAFEEVSGQDLNWFFNQWYLGKGHPLLDVSYKTDATKLTIDVAQKQIQEFGVFRIPVSVSVFDDRGETNQLIWLTKDSNSFEIPTQGTVKNVIFDADASLLAEVTENKPQEWYTYQWNHSKHYIHRKTALQKVSITSEQGGAVALEGLKDPFWDIRITAIEKIGKLNPEYKNKALETLKTMAVSDSSSAVRAKAISILPGILTSSELESILVSAVEKDRSYNVVTTALMQLSKVNSNRALELCASLENEESSKMLSGISMIYSRFGSADKINFFDKVLNSTILQEFDKLGVLSALSNFAGQQNTKVQQQAVDLFKGQYQTGGMYTQMLLPTFMNQLGEKVKQSVAKYAAEEDKATKEGNTNAASIAKGNKAEAEVILNDITSFLKTIQPSRE